MEQIHKDEVVVQEDSKVREVSQEEDPNANSTNDVGTISELNIMNEPTPTTMTYEGGGTIEVKVVAADTT